MDEGREIGRWYFSGTISLGLDGMLKKIILVSDKYCGEIKVG